MTEFTGFTTDASAISEEFLFVWDDLTTSKTLVRFELVVLSGG